MKAVLNYFKFILLLSLISYNAFADPPAFDIVSVVPASPSCNGGSNGSITVTITPGGTPNYTYTFFKFVVPVPWVPVGVVGPNGNLSATLGGLDAGFYMVIVQDNSGNDPRTGFCTITQPTALTLTVNSTTNITCNGANNGSITATAGGATPSYTYTLLKGGVPVASNGTGSFPNLVPGNDYVVSVTDLLGCGPVNSAIQTITEPAVLNASIASTNITCFGGNNGTITLSSPSGGYGTYGYSINGGGTWQASGTFNSLTAGSYNVQIRDAANPTCIIVLNAALTLTQPAVLNAAVAKTDVTICFGNNNGSITISGPSGGSGNYEYTINGGASWQASGTYNSLTAGTYNVQIRDANVTTCVIILNAALTITQPVVLNASVASTNVT